jgi:hypothetical protein
MIPFSYSNEDIKDEGEEGWAARRVNNELGAMLTAKPR